MQQGSSNDPMSAFRDEFKRIWDSIRELSRPTGTSVASLVQQVQSLVAQVQAALVNLTASVISATNDYLSTGTVSMASLTLSGSMSVVNVTASGTVTSAGALVSPGSYTYQVQHNYLTLWINEDGKIGFSPSSVDTKMDLSEMVDPSAILGLTPYWGRYKWDDPDSPLKAFVLAEDVAAAGFGPDVAPIDDNGKPFTVNYSQLVVPLLSAVRAQQKQIDMLMTEVASLKA